MLDEMQKFETCFDRVFAGNVIDVKFFLMPGVNPTVEDLRSEAVEIETVIRAGKTRAAETVDSYLEEVAFDALVP